MHSPLMATLLNLIRNAFTKIKIINKYSNFSGLKKNFEKINFL